MYVCVFFVYIHFVDNERHHYFMLLMFVIRRYLCVCVWVVVLGAQFND